MFLSEFAGAVCDVLVVVRVVGMLVVFGRRLEAFALDGGSSVFRRKDNDKLLKRQLTAGLIHDWFAFATVAGLT